MGFGGFFMGGMNDMMMNNMGDNMVGFMGLIMGNMSLGMMLGLNE